MEGDLEKAAVARGGRDAKTRQRGQSLVQDEILGQRHHHRLAHAEESVLHGELRQGIGIRESFEHARHHLRRGLRAGPLRGLRAHRGVTIAQQRDDERIGFADLGEEAGAAQALGPATPAALAQRAIHESNVERVNEARAPS